ncbi:Uncharacterised protein [Mycobacterium tuberculosis]|uniref:Uncharacterized protein n=1 Tax=Mycobacterium tuberculosis TaxID=1773 RepID=A0A654T5D0_MYCTX|nr:Uncharacterised protein [Mycobacterium tuberculosis]COY10619.1 Uncharacterised protein [Mycobacterium tuberculosis]COZ52501.1 Uncharacterised protein [Mycobacterium tuberculosis]
MRFGFWSSENADHPGAALVGNDSLPALIESPMGCTPPDTFGVQPVAVCWENGCDVGALVAGEVAVVDLLSPRRPITRITTSRMTPSTARPARISHGVFDPGPGGGGPGG